jgi:pyruvate formate lyase activating enzyme
MRLAHEKGLKNVWVTNGFMTLETLDQIIPFLDAANVDYKGPNDGVYETYCGASADSVMENMRYLQKAGVHLEITTLIVPGVNDSINQLEAVANNIVQGLGPNVPWHISRFFPAWKMQDKPITPLKMIETARDIGQKAGIKVIHLGNV